jgi:hypothetical protein
MFVIVNIINTLANLLISGQWRVLTGGTRNRQTESYTKTARGDYRESRKEDLVTDVPDMPDKEIAC